MLTPLIAQAVTYLLPLAPAPDPAPGVTLDTQGIVSFIVSKIVPIIFAVIGVLLLLNARKQRMSDVFETLAKVIIAVGVIGGGTLLFAFGDSLVKVFIN